MKIEYTSRDVYGRQTFYPHSGDAHMICRLLKQKTLTQRDLEILASDDANTVTRIPT